ncbi:MAG: GTP-binding protein [Deltaproteobacteria bacterium]
MEEQALHIVIVGHVDHGKSTLVGRLFYDTGALSPERFEEIKRASEAQGKPFEFAYIMDNLLEERQRGITIDVAHTFFSTQKRKYVIIDAPGHKEFIKNMITGTSQAEAAMLIVDASRGIEDQTLRHCYILGMLGIRQVAVIVNKMDLVGYAEDAFKTVKGRIEGVLEGLKITPAYIIPVAANSGQNVASKSENLSWHKGPTVLEALDSFSPLKIEEAVLRLPVQDIYMINSDGIAVGRVESGTVKKGQQIYILPGMGMTSVREIKKFGEENVMSASAGECVGISIGRGWLKRGDVLVDRPNAIVTKNVHANIFWMNDRGFKMGDQLTFKCATQETSAAIDRIIKRFDPASIEVIEKDAREIKAAEVAEVDITLFSSVSIDMYAEIPELGRFVLESDGVPVAGGIIV